MKWSFVKTAKSRHPEAITTSTQLHYRTSHVQTVTERSITLATVTFQSCWTLKTLCTQFKRTTFSTLDSGPSVTGSHNRFLMVPNHRCGIHMASIFPPPHSRGGKMSPLKSQTAPPSHNSVTVSVVCCCACGGVTKSIRTKEPCNVREAVIQWTGERRED